MRPRTLALSLLVTGAACYAAYAAWGPLGGLAMGALAFWLLCGLSLYLSTRVDRADEPLEPAQGARTANVASKPNAADEPNAATAGTTVPDAVSVAPMPKTADAPATNAASKSAAKDDTPPAAEAQPAGPSQADPNGNANAAQPADSDGPAALNEPTNASRPSFDYNALERTLLLSSNPLARLRTIAERTRAQQEKGEPVAAAQAFLARQLDDAGLLGDDVTELEHIGIARPHHSGLFYVRTAQARMSYGSHVKVLRLEAALNALHFAHEYYDDLDAASENDLYRLWQRTTASICAQAADVDTADWSYLAMPWQPPLGPADQGEWAVRHALSEAIESAQLPYRLEARFRCNVAAGDVAIEFLATPARAFPLVAYVSGLGMVSTTAHMRGREAAAYVARVGILLASHTFRASAKIRRVWVAAVEETPTAHRCLYSVCMGRRAFSHVRMAAVGDPLATLRSLGASFEEVLGTLVPTKSIFYLEDERFCPPLRHDLWSMSERSLPVSAVRALGASRVSGLVIHEELPRNVAADELMRGLARPDEAGALQKSVRSIMDIAQQTSDLSVWSAAERVSAQLVEGRLELNDPEAVRNEFVAGDSLTRAVERAQSLLAGQDVPAALRLLQGTLAPIESERLYASTKAVAYRSFDSFSERVMYNRLNAHDKRSVVLVPDAYLMAHLMLSALLLALPKEEGGHARQALEHARRALEVAPLNASANLGMAACLEANDDLEGAVACLKEFLDVSWHPQGMGVAYLKLASLMGQQGKRTAAQACYQRAVQLFPPLLPFALSGLSQDVELMDETAMERALRAEQIPVAPTPRTSYILYDGATASIDAEVFPVARELMRMLEALTGDDVIRGIRLSLEREPDA